jgi:hypothetical protein
MTRFNFKLFCCLSLGFLITVLVGTISHEAGHWLMAKVLGYNPHIHYSHTSYSGEHINTKDRILIRLAGPLQTMVTGCIGLGLLRAHQLKINSPRLAYWIMIFLSMFWLRPVINFVVMTIVYCITGELSGHSDETKLSIQMGLPVLTLPILTTTIGVIVFCWVFFKRISKFERTSFILAGIVGGGLSFWVWNWRIGQYILP